MTFLTDFADQGTLLPVALSVAVVLGLFGWRRGALAWAAVVLGTLGAMMALKMLFTACGPLLLPGVGLRTPSGHTAAAAVIYGGLAALLGLPAAAALAISAAAAILVGASRLVLGVHTLPEVVLGAVVGCIGAALLVRLVGPKPPRVRNAALLATLLVMLVLFHGAHLHAETAIAGMGRLFLSVCRPS